MLQVIRDDSVVAIGRRKLIVRLEVFGIRLH